ncbi:hypothetical protein V6N13_107940 [Hibiscus sabdariffa]|uniref:Uncharacterized protein n=1 Tax=Hibiscus sabdariffa TaxID=183260 RepID=A0ABR2SRP4_9ROSI
MWILSSNSSMRVLNSSMAVMLAICLTDLGLWIFLPSDFPGKWNEKNDRKQGPRHGKCSKLYFNGTSSFSFKGRTDEGFEESKRRVPSCPDPLHN